MKKLTLLILLFCSIAFSQTFEVVNKGYYYGKVGDTILPNRTTDLKALTDVQGFLEEHNLDEGQVIRPPLDVKRKLSQPSIIKDTVYIEVPKIVTDTIYTIVRDTIYIDNTIVNNPWMGEPITVSPEPIYGTTIYDRMTDRFVPQNAFDRDTLTFFLGYNTRNSWIGQDYEKQVSIGRCRLLVADRYMQPTSMNGSLIQYSDDKINWNTIHTISGITETNYTEWIDVYFPPVTGRYFRLYATVQASYCGTYELEFYTN